MIVVHLSTADFVLSFTLVCHKPFFCCLFTVGYVSLFQSTVCKLISSLLLAAVPCGLIVYAEQAIS